MLERVHEHITSELGQGARTDTVFILTAVFLNLLTLAINSSLAEDSSQDTSLTVVMFVFVTLQLVVNTVAVIGLQRGKQTRQKLLKGLLQMYKDEGVDGYYDASLLSNYQVRYSLFILTVVVTGLVALVIPFILR